MTPPPVDPNALVARVREWIALRLLVLRELVLGRVKLVEWGRGHFYASHADCAGQAGGWTPWGAMWSAAFGCSMCAAGPERKRGAEEYIERLRDILGQQAVDIQNNDSPRLRMLQEGLERFHGITERLEAENAALRAERDALTKDAERLKLEAMAGMARAYTLARIGGHAVVEDVSVPRDEIWWRNERGEYLGKLVGLDTVEVLDAARASEGTTR